MELNEMTVKIEGQLYKVVQLVSQGKPQMAGVWNHRPECRNPKLVQNYTNRQAVERRAGGSKPSINAI
jgi:hypothetical protein